MIGFLHTSSAHVATFDVLVAALDPHRPTSSVVDEGLLDVARTRGLHDPALVDAIGAAFDLLERRGATVIVCTCSSIAGLAERVGADRPVPVLRVDRPMAEAAVAAGPRIAVIATLASTLEPTKALVREVASAQAVEVTVTARVVQGAWDCWLAGQRDRHLDLIAGSCREMAEVCDVVVLAQASMADAADRLGDDFPIPVLASPAAAVHAASVR